MEENNKQLDEILQRLDALAAAQTESHKALQAHRAELIAIRNDVLALQSGQKQGESTISKNPNAALAQPKVQAEKAPVQAPVFEKSAYEQELEQIKQAERLASIEKLKADKAKRNSDLERLIGENIINKIGILMAVIGIGIGAKYTIDNNLIGPETRIVLGYLMGAILLFFAIRLKPNYSKFSAVLLGGAMSIFYFITYFAYDLYQLIPQSLAFGLMAVFTIFTAFAATKYDQKIIALLGLVGAYAVPFLLSNNTGNVTFLFSYIFIINLGIVALAYKRDWKLLSNTAFVLTWLIFLAWFVDDYVDEKHFSVALLFSTLFFVSFYVIALAFKLGKNEQLSKWNTVFITSNALIYYGISYAVCADNARFEPYLGLLTLLHAVVHFGFAAYLFRQNDDKKNLFYLGTTLTLIFLTIAIPVQLDGNWVTILWAAEAVLLFWVGRTKAVPIFEYLSYPALLLAFGSLLEDWNTGYSNLRWDDAAYLKPILNPYFVSSLAVTTALAFFNWMTFKSGEIKIQTKKDKILNVLLPLGLVFVAFGMFSQEILAHFTQLFNQSKIQSIDSGINFDDYNYALTNYQNVWMLNYTMVFLSIVSFFVWKKIKNATVSSILLIANLLAVLGYLVVGNTELTTLRNYFINKPLVEYYDRGSTLIIIRYIALACFGLLLYFSNKLFQQNETFAKIQNKLQARDLSFAFIGTILASSELLQWMALSGNQNAYKLGLSLLWGLIALILIVIGMRKKNKPIRIFAIVLFGLTLVKLMVYDIASLNTISKTIVFVSLGLLLLLISFLYNRANVNKDTGD